MKIHRNNLLTSREYDVLENIAKGLSNPEIATVLDISAHTVKAYIEHLFAKFQVHNKIQLVVYSIASGIIELDTNIDSKR